MPTSPDTFQKPVSEPRKKHVPSKRERMRKIKAIHSQFEMESRNLGLQAPSFRKGPVFYLALIAVMFLLGLAVLKASDSGNVKARARSNEIQRATKDLAAVAEALGRFKFHCGQYPTAEEGLEALALKSSRYEGWIGPYVRHIVPDPWKHAYVYEPTNEPPIVLSLGPDGLRGTADDISPDPALFQKPFRDTTWTNDWAPYYLRGYILVPSKGQKSK